jgi:hypothetical protein
LNEPTVVNHIRKWLQETGRSYEEDVGVDFLIREHASNDWLIDLEEIECKGTNSDFHRALGQCLDYYFFYDCIPTYLAIPKDYRQLEFLKQIIDFFKLPIGILLLDDTGKVTKEMETRGKTRCFKVYKISMDMMATNRPIPICILVQNDLSETPPEVLYRNS